MIKKIISSKAFRWTIMGLYAGLIFLVSSMEVTVSVARFSYMDKCVHIAEYWLFCTILCWAITAHFSGNKIRKLIIMAIIITSLYGFLDEIHQLYVPTRSGEFFDWIADTTGAFIAGICWLILFPARKRRVTS